MYIVQPQRYDDQYIFTCPSPGKAPGCSGGKDLGRVPRLPRFTLTMASLLTVSRPLEASHLHNEQEYKNNKKAKDGDM